jgi:hypothetical protein
MTTTKTTLLLTLALALSFPTAAALQLHTPQLPVPEEVTAWNGRSSPDLPASFGDVPDLSGVGRPLAFVSAIGDVNKDGKADVLLERLDPVLGTASYVIAAGPDLQKTLWAATGSPGRLLEVGPDLNGDGILDPISVAASASVQSLPLAAAGGVSAGQLSAVGDLAFRPLAGATGQAFFALNMATGTLTRQASALPVGQIPGLATGTVSTVYGTLAPAGLGTLMAVTERVNTTHGGLAGALPIAVPSLPLPVPLPVGLNDVDADAVIQLMDLAGKVRSTIPLQQLGSNPLAVDAADLNLDGVPDLLVLAADKVSQVEEGGLVRPVVSAFGGTGGQALWSVAMTPIHGVVSVVPNVGDLDGDGTLDLAYTELKTATDAAAGASQQAGRLAVLSGATGAILGETTLAGSAVTAVPLGNVVGGSAAQALKVTQALGGGAMTLEAVDSHLKTLWTLSLPQAATPLNEVLDRFTGAVTGFTDLTGDGKPDIALALPAGSGSGSLKVEVVSGVDGKMAWSQAYEAVGALALLAHPVSGRAGDLLAVVQAPGATIASQAGTTVATGLGAARSLDLTLVRALDGVPVWRLPLEPQQALGALGQAAAIAPQVSLAGDLNGDGTQDIVVRLEHRLTGNGTTLALHGHADAVSADAVTHTRILSGQDGATLWAHTDEVQTGANHTRVPLADLGLATPLSGYSEVVSPSAPLSSPAWGLIAAVGTLALAAVAARRRQ